MPPSSHVIEEFDLDIQKKISLREAKAYLSKNNKTTPQVSKATSSIMGLFASLNIHYNKNTKVQKQIETDLKKL